MIDINRLTTNACMLFKPNGSVELIPTGAVVDPCMCTILECYTHHHTLDTAYQEYLSAVAKSMIDVVANLSVISSSGTAISNTMLLLRNNVLVCPVWSVPEAYLFATHADWPAIDKSQQILNLTQFSRRQAIVSRILLSAIGNKHIVYPQLTRQEFSDVTQSLLSTRLLTVPVGEVDFGDLRTGLPFCSNFGFSRGEPIDRYYQLQFLHKIRRQVVGATLEIGGRKQNMLSYGFAGATKYTTVDLDPAADADILGDAHNPEIFPSGVFDSVVLFNVLEHCERPWVIVENIHRWLRRGGQAFCMVPVAQRVHRHPRDYWRFLPDGLQSLFGSFDNVQIESYGNLLTSISALSGIAAEEMSALELHKQGLEYPVTISVIAQKQ